MPTAPQPSPYPTTPSPPPTAPATKPHRHQNHQPHRKHPHSPGTHPQRTQCRVRYATTANLSDSTYHRTYNPNYQLTGLKPNTTYYIQVRVISADGTTNLTPYSPTINFTTSNGTSYQTPTGIKTTNRTANTLALAWNPSPNAPRYRVRYATTANFTPTPTTAPTTPTTNSPDSNPTPPTASRSE